MMDNILFLCLDSVTYRAYMNAETPNMDAFGLARRVHSFACTTGPSLMGYFMNKPPIGIGHGLFEAKRGGELRKFMPRYYMERGYVTAWLSGNPVIIRIDEQLEGSIQRWFNYWKATEYLKDVATPDIVRDLNEIVQREKGKPLFVMVLLLDTHTPYHDGEGLYPLNPYKLEYNYRNQRRAVEYVDSVFPLILKPFKEAGRPLRVIITSDHGECYGGWGWGHNAFRPCLRFDPQLFEIPFIMFRVDDWSKVIFERDS